MQSSNTQDEWNQNLEKVKSAHNGELPEYWYREIVNSGLVDEIAKKWNGLGSTIKIMTIEEYLAM